MSTAALHPRPRSVALSNRDPRLDALRGLCLLSMVLGHIAVGRWPDTMSHPLRVVDGAAGFVLLSGLVLGRVQRRRIRWTAPLQRAKKIWVAQTLLVLGALLVKAVTGKPHFIPSFAELGGVPRALLDVALLRVQPDWFTVLAFYVFALLITPLVVWGLSRGRTLWIAAASVAVWALSLTGTWNPASAGGFTGDGPWDWAGWQLLFVMGLLAGWHWTAIAQWGNHLSVRRVLLSVGSVALVVSVVLGHTGLWAPLFDKLQVGAGVPVVVLLLAAPSYWLVGRLPERVMAPLARTGANTLRGFVALSVVQFVLLTFWEVRPVGASLAVIAALVVFTWAGSKRSPMPQAHTAADPHAVALLDSRRDDRRIEERTAA